MKQKIFLQAALEEMGIYSYDEYQEKIKIWEDFEVSAQTWVP